MPLYLSYSINLNQCKANIFQWSIWSYTPYILLYYLFIFCICPFFFLSMKLALWSRRIYHTIVLYSPLHQKQCWVPTGHLMNGYIQKSDCFNKMQCIVKTHCFQAALNWLEKNKTLGKGMKSLNISDIIFDKVHNIQPYIKKKDRGRKLQTSKL